MRTYYGSLSEKGERGDRWRLKLQLLTRHGIDDQVRFKPQPLSLIITISDPEKKARVYDEMAQIVLSRFQAENLNAGPQLASVLALKKGRRQMGKTSGLKPGQPGTSVK